MKKNKNKTGFQLLKEAHKSNKDGLLTAVLHPVQSTFTLIQFNTHKCTWFSNKLWWSGAPGRFGPGLYQGCKTAPSNQTASIGTMRGSCRERVRGYLLIFSINPSRVFGEKWHIFILINVEKQMRKEKKKRKRKKAQNEWHGETHQQWHLVVELMLTLSGMK